MYEAKPGVPGPEFVKSKNPSLSPAKADGRGKDKPAAEGPAEAPPAPGFSSSTGEVPLNALEESPEPTPASLAGPACFPSDALVTLSSGRTVRMDALRVGDRVQTSAGAFSRVFMFTHRVAGGSNSFVELRTAAGRSLRASAGHLLYADGALRPARAVSVGMRVVGGDGAPDAVVRVRDVEGDGLFNPQTEQGDIVVDGVVASGYTEAVRMPAAHALLAPVRAAFGRFGVASGALEGGWPLLRWGAARVLS